MQQQRQGRGGRVSSKRSGRKHQEPRSTGPKCSCGSLLTGVAIGIAGCALYLEAASSYPATAVVPDVEHTDSQFQVPDVATDVAIDVSTGVAGDALSEGEYLSAHAKPETVLLCARLSGRVKCVSLNEHWDSQTSQAEFFENLPETAKVFMVHYLDTHKDDGLIPPEAKSRSMTFYINETDWPRLMSGMSVTHEVTIVAS